MDIQEYLDAITNAAYTEAVAWRNVEPDDAQEASNRVATMLNDAMDWMVDSGWSYDRAWIATEQAHARGWRLAQN